MQDIDPWLRKLGLEAYIPVFAEHAVDSDILPELTDSDLEKLGLKLGHRKKLLRAIATLESDAAGPDTPGHSPGVPSARRGRDAIGGNEPERRIVTVVFADMVGSTELSQQLDPEDLSDLLRAYQGACKRAIDRYEGFLARYVGDGVLAYFGFPEAHEDAPERAVRAGLAIVQSLNQLDNHLAARRSVKLEVRVGIATGEVVAGELIGEGASKQSTVVGQTPNLAARLQSLAHANDVVISPSTHKLVGRLFTYSDLGPQRLKGFKEPINAWRVEQERPVESRFEALHPRILTPIVGREEEVELLLRRWRSAEQGEGQAVLISGEPGIGKSRVVEAHRGHLETTAYTPLRFQCSPYHTNSALYPIISQLKWAAQLQTPDSPKQKVSKLEALLGFTGGQSKTDVAALSRLLSIPSEGRHEFSDLPPKEQKEQILQALLARLEYLAAERPVLLVFEDIHWIDPTSRELLELMLERISRLRVLVLVTCRPDGEAPWTGEAHVTTISLRKLNKTQCGAMVRNLTQAKALPGEIYEEIHNKTDGVPLFVEELTTTILESGLLTERDGRYLLEGTLPSRAIPATLNDSLMSRLDRLGSAKEIAQVGAVIGREFTHGLLSAVANTPDTELEHALARLIQAGQILRRGTAPDATYTFKHALVQDAAYESLLKSRRQHLHGAIAHAIEVRFPERLEDEPEVLAHHYSEANLLAKSIPCWCRAGLRALERSAIREAISHLRKGIDELDTIPSKTDRHVRQELELQTALGAALINSKGWGNDAVGKTYLRAQVLCEKLRDEDRLFPILFGLRSFRVVRAELRQAHEISRQLMELAEQSMDAALRSKAHLAIGMTLFYYGEFAKAQDHLELGLTLCRSLPRAGEDLFYGSDTEPSILSRASLNLWHLGFTEKALVTSEENLSRVEKRSHAFNYSLIQHDAAMLHQMMRHPEMVAELAQATIVRSSEYGFSSLLASGKMLLGWASVMQGGTGIAQIQEGLVDYRATGSEIWRPYFLSLLAEAYCHTEEHDAGLAVVVDALKLSKSTGERWYEAELYRLQGELWLERADADETRAAGCFCHALDVAASQNAKSHELRAAISLARLYLAQGQPDAARSLLTPLCSWFKERGDAGPLEQLDTLIQELP